MKKLIIFILLVFVISCSVPDNSETKSDIQEEQAFEQTEHVEDIAGEESIEEAIEPEPPKELQKIPEPAVETPPKVINGKTLEERLDSAYDNLHDSGSSGQILDDFPDVELVYTDDEAGGFFPSEILPFHYYYSEEADTTFNLCGVGRSVFICKGKLDRPISKDDIDSGRCKVTPIYLDDPRLGGSGKLDYDFE